MRLVNHGACVWVPRAANHICQSNLGWWGVNTGGGALRLPGLYINSISCKKKRSIPIWITCLQWSRTVSLHNDKSPYYYYTVTDCANSGDPLEAEALPASFRRPFKLIGLFTCSATQRRAPGPARNQQQSFWCPFVFFQCAPSKSGKIITQSNGPFNFTVAK